MHNCENCKLRKKYDRAPDSVLGKLWRWHTGWCPGWKSYLKSLPADRRLSVQSRYRPVSAR